METHQPQDQSQLIFKPATLVADLEALYSHNNVSDVGTHTQHESNELQAFHCDIDHQQKLLLFAQLSEAIYSSPDSLRKGTELGPYGVKSTEALVSVAGQLCSFRPMVVDIQAAQNGM